MTFSPDPVEIGDSNSTEDFQRMCRGVIDVGLGTSDYLANHAVDLHPRITALLRSVGADGPSGLFGRGSEAESHATSVYRTLRKAADSAETVAKLMQAAERAWMKHVVETVRQAESARKRTSTLKV